MRDPAPAQTSIPLAATGRLGWIDAARGCGIILVVAGHALGGIIDSPRGAGMAGLRYAFFGIYTFHMPLFLVLAGLFVAPRVQRGAGDFVAGGLRNVAWPYFLWSALQFTAIWAAGSLVNRPAQEFWPTLVALPWRTVSQFWFLYALFWMHLLAALVLQRGGTRALVVIGVGLKLLAAFAPLDVTIRLVANNLAWYAMGTWIGAARLDRLLHALSTGLRTWVIPLAAAAVVALTLSAAVLRTPDQPLGLSSSPAIAAVAWRLFAVPAALLGTLAVLGLATLPNWRESTVLRLLGERSMAIFILHVLFVAGTRILLARLGLVTDPLPLLAVLVAVGLAGPLMVDCALRPLGSRRWLGF